MDYIKKNREKINQFTERYALILDDYKKGYVTTHLYPSVEEYKKGYMTALGWLEKITNELFAILNEIQRKIQVTKKELSALNKHIIVNKKENESLLTKYQNVKGERNGSGEMVSDFKILYKEQYYSNWNLVFCIFFIFFLFYYLFQDTSMVKPYTK